MAARLYELRRNQVNAQMSWWTEAQRDGFTSRAHTEAPRMLRNPEASKVSGVFFEIVESMRRKGKSLAH